MLGILCKVERWIPSVSGLLILLKAASQSGWSMFGMVKLVQMYPSERGGGVGWSDDKLLDATCHLVFVSIEGLCLRWGSRGGGGGDLYNKLTAASILAFLSTFVGWVSSRWAW